MGSFLMCSVRLLKTVFACFLSVHILSSYRCLLKDANILRRSTVILPVVWCGCETWFRTLRDGLFE
jgi:hypothetical protein